MFESLSMTAYPTAAGIVCAAFPLLLAPGVLAAGPGGAEPGGSRTGAPVAGPMAAARAERASSGWG